MKIFSTEGRLNRAPFIGYSLGLWFLLAVIFIIWVMMIIPDSGNPEDINWGHGQIIIGLIIFSIISVVWAIAYVMICIRRLHDLDKDGFFVIAAFIPTVNFIFYLYLAIVKGTSGPNKYGEDPLLK